MPGVVFRRISAGYPLDTDQSAAVRDSLKAWLSVIPFDPSPERKRVEKRFPVEVTAFEISLNSVKDGWYDYFLTYTPGVGEEFNKYRLYLIVSVRKVE